MNLLPTTSTRPLRPSRFIAAPKRVRRQGLHRLMRIQIDDARNPRSAEQDEPARILIVDDEPAVGDVVGLLLQSLGYASSSCCNPTEALAQIKCGNFDVILTDFRMPKMTGVELAQEARKCNSLLPVILMTGYASTMETNEMQLSEINRVLEKPIVLPHLEMAIRSSLNNRADWY